MVLLSPKNKWGFFFLTIMLVSFCSAAIAEVKNSGNTATQIEIKKKSGFSQRATLYPGQAVALPEDALSVEVMSFSFENRGDTIIKIEVVESNGNSTLLESFGKMVKLGKSSDDAEELIVFRPGKATNKGNITLDVTMKSISGLVQKRTLYIEQSVVVSKDILEVTVSTQQLLRGDEKIKLKVSMPDGVEHEITGKGGTAKLKEEALLQLGLPVK